MWCTRLTQRRGHAYLNGVIAEIGRRTGAHGNGYQLLGDIDSRCRAGLDNPFHQQFVIGANHGVARDRQLLGQPAGRWQSGTRRDPGGADRLADLIGHLGRERLRSRSIQENRNLHFAVCPVCLGQGLRSKGRASSAPDSLDFDRFSAFVSQFIALTGLDLLLCKQLDSSRPVRADACPGAMQQLPQIPQSRLTAGQGDQKRADRAARRRCHCIFHRWPSASPVPDARVSARTATQRDASGGSR
jgi:hypothetical protein